MPIEKSDEKWKKSSLSIKVMKILKIKVIKQVTLFEKKQHIMKIDTFSSLLLIINLANTDIFRQI